MLIHISHGIKYQFLKKIYDVINKVYMFKFENLTIFTAFPLPSMETGVNTINQSIFTLVGLLVTLVEVKLMKCHHVVTMVLMSS